MLRASRDAGIKRVVQTSSTFAITYGRGGATESLHGDRLDRRDEPQDTAAYHRSKTIAERAVWAWHAAEGGALELTTVNPGVILGPVLGPDFSTSILLIKRLLDGSMPALPHFGFNLVDVRDNANLHLLAMTSPKAAGQRFIGSCGFYWMDDIAKVLKQGLASTRAKSPLLSFPTFWSGSTPIPTPNFKRSCSTLGSAGAPPRRRRGVNWAGPRDQWSKPSWTPPAAFWRQGWFSSQERTV